MNPVSAVVLYLIVWVISLFVILPQRLTTQSEDGNVVDGTPPSSPVNPMLRKKMVWTTLLATIVYLPLVLIIVNGWISIDDIDIFKPSR